MLSMEPAIVTRLRAHLAADWRVMGFSEPGDRKAPGGHLASVLLDDDRSPNPRATAAMVPVAWVVQLITQRATGAAVLLDTAFSATVGALHNWHPGEHAGRRWEPMQLVRVLAQAQPTDDRLIGVELTFSTQALYRGQD